MSEAKHTPVPSAGALRAAELIALRYCLGPNTSTRILIATTIDKETAAPDLLEAADYLIHSIGKSGWVDASPLVAERRARVGEVNALRAAIARAKGEGS
jgi:hypothetical protein